MTDVGKYVPVAIPVRAVPYASARDLRPTDIAAAIAEPPNYEGRRFASVLRAHYFDQAGTARTLLWNEATDWARRVNELDHMNAPLQEQVAAMPVGVFVWQSELHALVDEINSLLPVDAPHGLVPQPIDLNLHPLLTDAETSLVFAGFVRAVGISVLPASSQGVRSGLTTPEELLTQFSLAHNPANKGAVPYPTTKVVERPLTGLEQDKLEAQHIAQTQWLTDPNLSIETIARSAAMRHLKNKHPGKNTIRGWIAEVDTRPPERRRGRRRGSTSN